MEQRIFTVNPFQENTYLLFDESGDAIVIDPGFYYPAEFEAFYRVLEEQSLTLKAIINTHCHIDHVLGIGKLVDRFNVPFYAHSKEMFNIERVDKQAAIFGFPLKDLCPEPDIFIEEDAELRFGALNFKVLFVPGHSPGHVAFYDEKRKAVWSGDVLFNGSIGRTDLPGCDHQTLINSIETVMYNLPDDTTVYAGHMEETTIRKEKRSNPFVRAV